MDAHTTQADEDRCFPCGMDPYVPKAVNLERISQNIDTVV